MGAFLSNLLSEFLKSLQGPFHWGHLMTIAVGLIFLFVAFIRYSDHGTVQGTFTLISTLFYVYAFWVTWNNYANPVSFTVLFVIAVVLQFLMWMIAEGLTFWKCLLTMFCYLFIPIPFFFVVSILAESVAKGVSEWTWYQLVFMLSAAILSIAVPMFANMSGSGHSSGDSFEETYGPGWGVLGR